MAILHRAELVPTKAELLSAWLPSQAWAGGEGLLPLEPVGAFRLDDPGGEVGIEAHIVRSGRGRFFHVPVTYRGASLDDASEALIGTTQHSALGKRWVYDACADPVYVHVLVMTILKGGRQADMYYQSERGLEKRGPTSYAWGTGTEEVVLASPDRPAPRLEGHNTVLDWGERRLTVLRDINPAGVGAPAGAARLLATWPGQDDPVTLAWVTGTRSSG